MSGLDLFALIILITLTAAALAIWVMLGMMPGRIAAERDHPQVEAIRICGWLGAITLGILSPLAFVWAYTRAGTRPSETVEPEGSPASTTGIEHEPEAGS
jgi:hypothetical protein